MGACIGAATLNKQLGRKAMLWGMLAQSVPDIDFIASFWLEPSENVLAHRGFTHSILFALLITPALALAADHWHRPHNIKFSKFVFFFGLQVFVHIILDAFNNYGVGWFEPFSHQRISFNVLFVADPLFSIWLGIACLALLILTRGDKRRKLWIRFGLIIPALYLCYALYNKIVIDKEVRKIFQHQQISYNDYFTTPTIFNNWLWYVIAASDSGYHVGFRSVFDRKETIDFAWFPRNDTLLAPVTDEEEVNNLLRFSRGFYTVEKWNDTLVFNDLQFGQIAGWQNPTAKFAFHYFLKQPRSNRLVVQRGRFKGWNRETVQSLIKRIKGN